MFIAGQSETEGDNFRIAEIVPSFHLCMFYSLYINISIF